VAKPEEHLSHAVSNLTFLEQINKNLSKYLDWQVTVCFYSALHLVNAHLARYGLHYRTHTQVKHALNPKASEGTYIDEDAYVSFIHLQILSRRSRYLLNIKGKDDSVASLIYDKHLATAYRHLNVILDYYKRKYGAKLPCIKIKCVNLKKSEGLKSIEVYE
jgi:uncharacterized protein (UPF0332 family)